MKLNFGLLGIALGQSGDDYSDERHDYSYDYNLGNSHYSGFGGSQNYAFNNFGGKLDADTKNHQARRLSCWNSNSLRDMNHDGKFNDGSLGAPYHHYNHQYGFESAYTVTDHELADHGHNIGTDRHIDPNDAAHGVAAVNPNKWGYQNENPDAKYHYGHRIEQNALDLNENRPQTVQIDEDTETFDGVIDDWRYSLRHSGCLYEAPDFFYGAGTFNKMRFLTYSQFSHDGAGQAVGTETLKAYVHWVHVFNAHIHIDDYCPGSDHIVTENQCINGDAVHQFAVVMANPTYEGLGFINFVATYHDPFTFGGANEAGHRFRSNYAMSAMYENTGFWHLSSDGQDTGTNVNVPTWHLDCDSTDCLTTTWMSGTLPRGLAISSFPHNELGHDFRFNIRTLHTMGDGVARGVARARGASTAAYSYFFYAIDSIEIKFPEYVARVNECWRARTNVVGGCEDHMVQQVIVDQSAVQATSASPQNTNGDIAGGNFQLMAGLSNSDSRCGALTLGVQNTVTVSSACASWCANSGQTVNGNGDYPMVLSDVAGDNDNNLCGDTLTITGMVSTYDELHLRQFGTIQEIWVQLMYAYSHATTFGTGDSVGMESPFPNVFFSAPQTLSVTGACAASGNYGKCDGYTREQNVPYAGSDTDADRWVMDVDGDGGMRGDAFWPDALNAT